MEANNAATRKAEIRAAWRERFADLRENGSDDVFGIEWRPYRSSGSRGRGRASIVLDGDPFTALMGLQRFRETTLARLELLLVVELRASGVSWDDVGFALDVTGERARQRYAAAVVDFLRAERRG